jgi:1-acyl-sn-glycerol-3-phosphate acyltransferase
VCPVRFISKVEVRNWPVIGWLVTMAGTLFIERASRRDAVRVVHSMAESLAKGDALAVFPEGTTSDGHDVLPFHGNLLQAAISTGTPVQPVALLYSDPQHTVSPAVAYIGDTTLMQSLWMVVSAQGLRVCVRVLDAQATQHADRRALAAHLQEQIRQHVLR